MRTSFLAIIISALFVNYVYSQQEITCYMCQVGLQQISTSLQGNKDAMSALALEFVESCDTVPSESQALACKHLFEPEVFPQFVKNFVDDPTMQPSAMCQSLGFC